MTTRDTVEITPEVTTEVIPDPVEVKRTAKIEQLASARQSMKDKKRKRDDDLSSLVTKLDQISNRLDQQQKPHEIEENTDPPSEKRQRVTKDLEVEDTTPIPDSWATSLVRTGAVLTLGAASWWMQNMYGKAPTTITRKVPEKKKHRRRYPRRRSCSLTICKLRVTVK